MKRRDFLVGGAAGALACALRPTGRSHAAPRKAPRALVIVQLSGGMDPIMTLDPKTPSEVESWVDNPVRAADIIEAGNIRLGPQLAPLARWAPKMAVVHGVQVESVNHASAIWQLVRMKTVVSERMPGILDLVARHRPQPLGAITVGNVFNRVYTPSWIVDGLPFVKGRPSTPQGLAPFEAMAPDELAMLSRAMKAQLKHPALNAVDRANMEKVIALVDRLPTTKRFALEDWKPDERMKNADEALQRVLWGLETDLISGAYVVVSRNDWDTHFANITRQDKMNGTFLPLFDRFLDQLATRTNQHGTLLDNTTVVLASEMGRYPRLNSDKGKDHFPEMSMLVMGAGVRGAQTIGATAKDMIGYPMDPATGKQTGTSHLLLDDVGTTLLELFGIDPIPYGYGGRVIRPVIA